MSELKEPWTSDIHDTTIAKQYLQPRTEHFKISRVTVKPMPFDMVTMQFIDDESKIIFEVGMPIRALACIKNSINGVVDQYKW